MFAEALRAYGDRPALISPDISLTYAGLHDRVEDAARSFGGGRRLVMIEAANRIEALVAYLGALYARHPILLFSGECGDHAAGLIEIYNPDVLCTAASGWAPQDRRTGSVHSLHPELALLLSTSGSTGASKLVRLSRDNLESNAGAIGQYLNITPDDRAITTLPMQYCYGLSVIHSHLRAGAGLVLSQFSVLDGCFWDQFRAKAVTCFAGVPYTFDLLDRVDFKDMQLPSLRYITQAGGRLHPDQVRKYAQMGERDGWELVVMYGQTEATARMAYLPPALAAAHPRSIGIPIPGGSFTIERLDGRPGECSEGELIYHGPNVMLGYAESPADLALGRTCEALKTGDVGRLSSAGLIELVGRRSRFAKLCGLRIDLDRIEHILEDAGVANMCAADEQKLVVATSSSGEHSSVTTLLKAQVGLPACYFRVVATPELPRLANGKGDYPAILSLAAGDTESAGKAADLRRSTEEKAQRIRALFAETLGAEIPNGESFVSAGGDSLSYVQLSLRLEEVVGKLPRDWHTMPIEDLIRYCEKGIRGRGRPLFRYLETSIVLRAVAVVLVVGMHTGLWELAGGGHVLLAISGFNFARFQRRNRKILPTVARIAIPSMIWIGFAAAVTVDYSWPHALLLNGQFGAPGARWSFWYIEAVVQILLVLALVFAIPGVRRLEQRYPIGTALLFTAPALAVRFNLIQGTTDSSRIFRPQEIFWIFAIGWLAAIVKGAAGRALLSLLVLATVPGFFGMPGREALVAAGLLLVIWVPSLPVPRRLSRLTGTIAGASLYIYLTHWLVYPLFARFGSLAATAGAVVVGILVGTCAQAMMTSAERRIARIRRFSKTGSEPHLHPVAVGTVPETAA